jgi:prepilin-type N-terminal cleavage/methylation domain-containing protein
VRRHHADTGFSLLELLIATALILGVSSIVTSALLQMTKHQQTTWNRTEMHSGVRGATELLQQEIGQAGRITLPTSPVTLNTAVTVPAGTIPCTPIFGGGWTGGVTPTVTLSSVAGMWADVTNGIKLTLLDGNNSETVIVQTISTATSQITACFSRSHPAIPVTVMALGGFAEGIIGPSPSYTAPWSSTAGTYVHGSDANHLKLLGDTNGDGKLVYVEYFCDNGDVGTTASHNLYRSVMAFNAASKPAATAAQVLLSNIYPNPMDNAGAARPCFKYQWVTITGQQYVLDVAITLTVQTLQVDSVTKMKQTETKALLNITPRNVFNVWTAAGYGDTERVQATPPSVTALLP